MPHFEGAARVACVERAGFEHSRFERAGFERAGWCKSESCRARSSRRDLAFRERVVSCAQRRTRPRAARSKQSRKAARRTSCAPSKRSSSGPHHVDPPEAPEAIVLTPRVTRAARDTRRTYARPELPGPVRARLVSRAKLVTRAATFKRENDGIPSGDRRPPTEGRTGRGPRNPTDSEPTRSRVGAEPPRVSRDVSGSAHTRPRSPGPTKSTE